MWAAFGGIDYSRVKDIVIESDWTRTYHKLAGLLGQTFRALPFHLRSMAVRNVEWGRDWNYGLTSPPAGLLRGIIPF